MVFCPLLGRSNVNNMALKTVDLTQQPHRVIFTGCSQEEVNYAKTFWQSLQLLPPMESRLVSSDIKQRLRKAPPSRSMSECSNGDGSDSHDSCYSFAVTFSTSSSCLKDTLNKVTIHPKPNKKSGSLTTQTSYLPNFGEPDWFGKHELSGRLQEGRGRSYEEASLQLASFDITMAGQGLTSEETEKKSSVWGQQFWSGGGEGTGIELEDELSRDIEPFSGEDLCQQKGFSVWSEQTALSKQVRCDPVECGGEELRGQREQFNSTKTLHYKPTEKLLSKQAQALVKTGWPKRSRKTQRVVGTSKQPVTSRFVSRNIILEEPLPRSQDTGVLAYLFFPVMKAVSENFTKHIMPTFQLTLPKITVKQENLNDADSSGHKDTAQLFTGKEGKISSFPKGEDNGTRARTPVEGMGDSGQGRNVMNTNNANSSHISDQPIVHQKSKKDILQWAVWFK